MAGGFGEESSKFSVIKKQKAVQQIKSPEIKSLTLKEKIMKIKNASFFGKKK